MSYTYAFIPAGDPIQNSPKQTYKDDFQATVRQYFYESTNWITIEEETSVASGLYQNVDVRINSLISPTVGDNQEDDFKKLTFADINQDVQIGKLYRFNDNYWISINPDKIQTLAQGVLVRRCNNMLRWIDEETGALYQVPCAINYLVKENRDYATAGSAVVVPSGMIDCFYQVNSKTNKIKPNQRFLFGNPSRFTAYRIEGGGINNFNNQITTNNNSSYLGRFTMAVDYSNNETDNIPELIANYYVNNYVISINQSSISGGVGQTVQLLATVTLNGNVVTRNFTWTSSNQNIATVNASGLVTFVATGSCVITCSLENNTTVSDTCSASVVGSPVDNYQVVISPDKNYILEGLEQIWTVYLYKNGVIQADTFVFTLDANTVPSTHYVYTPINGNSFKIENLEMYLEDVLEISCVSGIYSNTLSVELVGAWAGG